VSSYRFCRTDDMPLLVEAYNRAFIPHLSPRPAPLDVAGLKRWIRDVDLWCSSCLIARDDSGKLIGVLLGCKRPTETLVLALGVHPEHLRQGHGRHLLTSLSSKLAILGPPRLVAEVPADDARACAFFESCGWTAETRMRDYTLDLSGVRARLAPELVQEVTASELIAAGALALDAPRPWARAVPAVARRDDVQGLAIASPDRIEAWVLWRDVDGVREIQGLGSAPGADLPITTLFGHFAALAASPIVLATAPEQERSWTEVPTMALGAGRLVTRYVATARAA